MNSQIGLRVVQIYFVWHYLHRMSELHSAILLKLEAVRNVLRWKGCAVVSARPAIEFPAALAIARVC